MRASVYVNDYRILLCRIEILRLDEAVIVVIETVGALYCTERYFCVSIVESRVFCLEKACEDLSVRAAKIGHARIAETAPAVCIMSAVRAHRYRMPSFSLCEPFRISDLDSRYALCRSRLRELYGNSEEMVLDRGYLSGCVPYIFAVVGDVLHVCVCRCESAHITLEVAEIQVAVAVPVVRTIEEDVV